MHVLYMFITSVLSLQEMAYKLLTMFNIQTFHPDLVGDWKDFKLFKAVNLSKIIFVLIKKAHELFQYI